NQNLAGSYAIANRIDASATAGWNSGAGFTPIGDAVNPFSGAVIGAGGDVPFVSVGATIESLTINSAADYVGLFGVLSDTANIQGVNLTNVDITGLAADGNTGGVAGANNGTITYSS